MATITEKDKFPEGIEVPKAGKQIQNFHLHSLQDNLTTCSMHEQNVKKAESTTAQIDASCHVVGYASETQ